jgi:hypothetical protein
MTDDESTTKQVVELLELDEAIFVAYFYHTLDKDR